MTILKNPLPDDEREIVEPIVGNTMLELGNKKNLNGTYKHYFESLGIWHISVDWNGEDGALKMDLRLPLGLGQFDMVTNIGTTEHVNEQIPVWKNIHNSVKLNGVLVSITPKPGDWWWHGEFYPKFEFFTEFAALNGYEIQILKEGREHPNTNVCARLRKVQEKKFQMPDESHIYHNKIRPR